MKLSDYCILVQIHFPRFSLLRRCPYIFYYFIFIFCLFRAALMAYESFQVGSQMRAAAAGLHHNHSNAKSELHLQPTRQRCWTLNPLSKNRDRFHVLMDTSQIRYRWATIGTPEDVYKFIYLLYNDFYFFHYSWFINLNKFIFMNLS